MQVKPVTHVLVNSAPGLSIGHRSWASLTCRGELVILCFKISGLTHIITMDLHQKEIQGFFSFPVDNLRASPFLLQYIQEEVSSRLHPVCPPCCSLVPDSHVEGTSVTFPLV